METVTTKQDSPRCRATWQDASQDPERALRAALGDVAGPDIAITFLFFHSEIDKEILRRVAADTTEETNGLLVGCSTAGELGPEGFRESGVAAFSLAGADIEVACVRLDPLSQVGLDAIDAVPGALTAQLGQKLDALDHRTHTFVTLFDGLSRQEDMITAYLGSKVARFADVIGGSAACELNADTTYLLHGGNILDDAALILLLEVPSGMALISGHHFHPTDTTIEITKVAHSGRLITEIDGQPAIDRYIELTGIERDDLDAGTAAFHPFATSFRGRWMICSIMGVTDRGLRMARGIEPEQQLQLMRAGDLVTETKTEMQRVRNELGRAPIGLLLFHCLGRTLIAAEEDVLPELFDAMDIAPLAGFSSYGEQFGTLHLNHTLTGIAF